MAHDEHGAGEQPAPLNSLFSEDPDQALSSEVAHTGSRKVARKACTQAIYQWLISNASVSDIIQQFSNRGWLRRADREYFVAALNAVIADQAGLEAEFDRALSRPASQLDPVEHAVLLLATYELRDRPEIPFKAVLNEATEMAKIYGAEGGYKFINGVLDRTAKKLRPHEH